MDKICKITVLLYKLGHFQIGFLGNPTSGNREIAMALFRVLDVYGGHIIVNGVDVIRVSLHTLRSKINVLPKDVALVDGSVRSVQMIEKLPNRFYVIFYNTKK